MPAAENDDNGPTAENALEVEMRDKIKGIKIDAHRILLRLRPQLRALFDNSCQNIETNDPAEKIGLSIELSSVTPDPGEEDTVEPHYVLQPGISILVENNTEKHKTSTGTRKRREVEEEDLDQDIVDLVLQEMQVDNKQNLADIILFRAAKRLRREVEDEQKIGGYSDTVIKQQMIVDAAKRAYWNLTQTELEDSDWL